MNNIKNYRDYILMCNKKIYVIKYQNISCILYTGYKKNYYFDNSIFFIIPVASSGI